MKNRVLMILVGSALLVFFFISISLKKEKPSEAATGTPRIINRIEGPFYKEGELLVKMRPGLSGTASLQANASIGARLVKGVGQEIQLVKLPEGMSVPEAMSLYKQNPDVLEVSPNYYIHAAQLFPDDPLFGYQWDMYNTGQNPGSTIGADIDAPAAWGLTTGNHNVVIAIVDTGVDIYHPDLQANLWTNPFEIPNNGVDDDNNGYIDDVHGINAITGSGNPMDDEGHGTHVAGTIGAVGNNGIGVAGVNWTVQIMACKFLDSTGSGTFADELECLNYVAMEFDRGAADVVGVNASYGAYPPLFTFQSSAIDSLRLRGILFIAAASNEGLDNDAVFHMPSSFDLPNIIAVGATNDSDRLAAFSNFGRETVHVGAPGVDIFSTIPVSMGSYGPVPSGMSGTSMGTPHVTGTIGLLYSKFPGARWYQVRNRILSGGDLDPFLVGKIMTGRRLNAYGALTCSGTTLLARIRPNSSDYVIWTDAMLSAYYYYIMPGRNSITTMFGGNSPNFFSVPLKLSALHIQCESPAGNVNAKVGGQTITLEDNGQPPFDLVAGDGVYSGQWLPPFTETTLTATFPNAGTSNQSFNDSFTVYVRKTNDPNGIVVADAGHGRKAQTGDFVELDGSLSSGPIGVFSPLIYFWFQISGPVVDLLYADTPFPTFVAPVATGCGEDQDQECVVAFQLQVFDLEGNTASDTVSVTVTAPGSSGGGSPCFIATAAYGSGDARSVVVLRQFRDRYLLTNAPGKTFVQLYYKYSPSAASFISNRPVLRWAVRIALLPVVAFAGFMLMTTLFQKLLVGTLLALMLAGSIVLVKKNRRLALQRTKAE